MPVPPASGPILTLVKEFVAHRAAHPFPEIDKPLDNRGKLERSLPNEAGGAANWWREFIDRQSMVCFWLFPSLSTPAASWTRFLAGNDRSGGGLFFLRFLPENASAPGRVIHSCAFFR